MGRMDLLRRIRSELAPFLAEGEEKRRPEPRPLPPSAGTLAPFLEHTLLAPTATREQVARLCDEATAFGFHGVCVAPRHVEEAAARLGGRGAVVTVVGFPLGSSTAHAKAFEAGEAARSGAGEIDMVLPLGAVKERDWAEVLRHVRAVVEAAEGRAVKVILETGALDDGEKVAAALLAEAAGASFVKTSTGFGKGGATPADVALLRRVVGDRLGIKASGGIRSAAAARELLLAGADRLGTSSSVAIVGEAG